MSYISAELIKELREKKHLTQKELADQISVSDKTVSKWETGKGLPDIGILEELSKALGISVTELLTGEYRENENRSANMNRVHFYVCPVCGNVITSVGKGSFSCCGILLPEQEAEDGTVWKQEAEDGAMRKQAVDAAVPGQSRQEQSHGIFVEFIDHEYFISMNHEMRKNHFISFMAYVTSDSMELKKLYPEQNAEARFRKRGHGFIYAYCNRHGMFRVRV